MGNTFVGPSKDPDETENKLNDRYEFLGELGVGGMAIVYRAFDKQLESEVAIKMIRREKLSPETLQLYLSRFKSETFKMSNLSHPNIVSVLDSGESDGLPYIVMKHLPGGTLKEKLEKRENPIHWQEVVRILIPIGKALEYAHKKGVVHRDIKPANILFSESGEPMLSDFGIAKALEVDETQQLTATGVGIGTPVYMAPEQAFGRITDHRADIYSLGIVFYEMVTGKKPFQGENPLDILFNQVNQPLPPLRKVVPGLPRQVEKVVEKALAKKPEQRYDSMGDFLDALNKVVGGKHNKDKLKKLAVATPFLIAIISFFAFYSAINGAKLPAYTDWQTQEISSPTQAISLTDIPATLYPTTPITIPSIRNTRTISHSATPTRRFTPSPTVTISSVPTRTPARISPTSPTNNTNPPVLIPTHTPTFNQVSTPPPNPTSTHTPSRSPTVIASMPPTITPSLTSTPTPSPTSTRTSTPTPTSTPAEPTIPNAPSNLRAELRDYDGSGGVWVLYFMWQDNSDNEDGFTIYCTSYQGPGQCMSGNVTANKTEQGIWSYMCTFEGGQQISGEYTVWAYNSAGSSPWMGLNSFVLTIPNCPVPTDTPGP